MLRIRPPAVAGTFYPAEPERLSADIGQMLSAAKAPPLARLPKALIVPHAGYIYSGPIAASAYACLRGAARRIRRVVLLGSAHRVHVPGLALPGADAFDMPLGQVAIDNEVTAGLPVLASAPAHAREHSLEVQIPFLQTVLGSFDLVPLAVGDADPEDVARVIEALWGGPDTLIVVSSDLSHYLAYATARAVDARTAQKIVSLQGPLDYDEACGAMPINGLLIVARRRGLVPVMLDVRTSGDTAGKKGEVVGYGAFAFYEDLGREAAA